MKQLCVGRNGGDSQRQKVNLNTASMLNSKTVTKLRLQINSGKQTEHTAQKTVDHNADKLKHRA